MQHWHKQKLVRSWSLMKRSMPSSVFGVLFEISRLKALNQPFELICEMGSLSKPENLAVQQTDAYCCGRVVAEPPVRLCGTVSAFNAKASVEEDRIRIWAGDCRSGKSRSCCIEMAIVQYFLSMASTNYTCIIETQFSEFDQFSQALLSSSLLQLCLVAPAIMEQQPNAARKALALQRSNLRRSTHMSERKTEPAGCPTC